MKHIVKNGTRVSQAYLDELHKYAVDAESLRNGAHENSDGRTLFEEYVKRMASYGDYCDMLLKEQGYTCCYCGCRIPHRGLPHFILEHLTPINADKTLVGEYRNMMIACDGGEKETPRPGIRKAKLLHCDQSKGNRPLPISPLQPDCEERIDYHLDGTVSCTVEDDKEAIDTIDILNLKSQALVDSRKEAIESYVFNGDELIDEDELRRLHDSMLQKDAEGKFQHFAFPVMKALEKLF